MAGFLNFTSIYLYGKCTDNPYNIHFKIPRSKVLPNISISNGKDDDAENWYSRQCTVSEESASSCDSEKEEAIASALRSDFVFLANTENKGKEDNPIDKLKALHLLVVAMEQRNASVLELCHR